MTLATECFIIDCKRGNDHCSTALTTKNSAITAVETTLHVPRCTYVQVHEHSSTSTAAEVNTSITYHLPPLASVTKHRLHALRCTGSRMSSGGQDKISLNELKDLFQLRIGTRETCKNRHIYPEFYDKIPWDEAESYPSAYQDKLREFGKPALLDEWSWQLRVSWPNLSSLFIVLEIIEHQDNIQLRRLQAMLRQLEQLEKKKNRWTSWQFFLFTSREQRKE